MKQCKVCAQVKPYDPAQRYQSKASGFFGNVCWACHINAQRLRMQRLRVPVPIERSAQSVPVPIDLSHKYPKQWALHEAYLRLKELQARVKDTERILSIKIRQAKHYPSLFPTDTEIQARDTAYKELQAQEALLVQLQGTQNENL